MPSTSALSSAFLLVLFCFSSAQAQWRGIRLSHLGPMEGLSSNVNAIAQDDTGYMYFGGFSGMYRYDGQHLTLFGHDPQDESSIAPGQVFNIYPASDGLLWITTRFGGLNSFNPKTEQFKRYPLPELPYRHIPTSHALYADPDGTLWVGSTHFRLLAFDRKTEQFTTYSPSWIDPEEDQGRLTVLSITPDAIDQDILWLSVLDYKGENALLDSYGLVSFSKSKKTFTPSDCQGQIRYQDDQGLLWGTYWGNFISRMDTKSMTCDTFQFHAYVEGRELFSISHDIDQYNHQLIVSTSNALFSFDPVHRFSNWSLDNISGEKFESLFVDRDHLLWIGTQEGALVLDPDRQHIRFFSLAMFGESGRLFPGRVAYYPPADAIYLSHTGNMQRKGFYTIPLGKGPNQLPRFHPTDFHIQGIACDAQNRLWIAGNGRFYNVDPGTRELTIAKVEDESRQPLPGVQNLKSSPDGWIGGTSSSEFVWFHRDLRRVNRIQLDTLPGSAFAKSFDNGFDGFSFAKHNKAFLFSNEIHLIDLKTGLPRLLKYNPVINPHHQRIQYVGEDQDGYIWIATFVHIGKHRLEDDSLILVDAYGIGEGLVASSASELHADSYNRIWAFTGSGMNGIDPVTREVRSFSVHEGLPQPFIDPRQVINLPDGRMATVCDDGLIVFQAQDLWSTGDKTNKNVIIRQIRVEGKKVAAEMSVNAIDTLILKPGNRGADIEFQALAFPTDYGMEYSYRVIGLQAEWISIGQNKLITLPSLPPGEYTFEVKAGSAQSSSPVKSLKIIVGTPLYMRWWFLLLVGGSALAIVYAIIRSRISRIRREEAERSETNKQMAELELKALRAQMNPHFMFNSLNSIKNYILHAEPKLAAEYLSSFAHLIRMILQNSREKSITLQEELDTLILYIELEQIRFDNKFEFSCVIGDGVQLEQVMIPPMLLQPFVENAIWHGLMHKKEKGHLMLSFLKQDQMISCVIDDDGVGRAKAAEMKSLTSTKYKSMGMGITRDRIEIMNKMDALGITIEVVDKVDAQGTPSGTTVNVNIPAVDL